jgi:predicted XRE-type DNA-binding protein
MKATVEHQTFANVWDAIEDDPAVAANMTMRSDLLIALQQCIETGS